MKVLERSLIAKTGHDEECEDGIVVTNAFAAVVDGATDKSGRRFDEMTGGRYAMQVVCRAIADLPEQIDLLAALGRLTKALAVALPDELAPADRPAAVTTIYSAARRELWVIGDVGYAYYPGPTIPPRRPHKVVDEVTIAMRVAVIRAALLQGATIEQLRANDIGRAAILPLLTNQWAFSNNSAAGELAYGVLNGLPVPEELVTAIPVPPGTNTVVIASDGYPAIRPTHAEAETEIRHLLGQDPLCIGPLAGTKGLHPGAAGYDDRAYLRLEL